MTSRLVPVGKTPEGLTIVQGVFPFVDTHGLPLEIVLDKLKDNNMMPDWNAFYQSAIKAGWHPERTFRRMEEAIGDIYGPEFREQWTQRFKAIKDGCSLAP